MDENTLEPPVRARRKNARSGCAPGCLWLAAGGVWLFVIIVGSLLLWYGMPFIQAAD